MWKYTVIFTKTFKSPLDDMFFFSWQASEYRWHGKRVHVDIVSDSQIKEALFKIIYLNFIHLCIYLLMCDDLDLCFVVSEYSCNILVPDY